MGDELTGALKHRATCHIGSAEDLGQYKASVSSIAGLNSCSPRNEFGLCMRKGLRKITVRNRVAADSPSFDLILYMAGEN